MFRQLIFLSARLGLAIFLLSGLLLPTRAVAPTAVVLSDSIKPVAEMPPTGTVNQQRAFISRKTLKPEENAAPLEFEVSLKMRNFSELQARVAKGERISPQEMAARYEPLASDYQAVAAWITGRGLTITRQDNHHMALFARGKISDIGQALQVTFARVTFKGQEYTSAITAPSVPAELSPVLLGINGLQPHLRAHKNLIKRQLHPDALGGGASYLPKQIAQAYNATALYNTNISGSGQSIAIVIDTFPATDDLVSFWRTANVSQSIGNIQFIQVVAGQLPEPSGEETLDVEWSSSIAPGARVRVYATTDFADADVDQAYQQIYDDVTNHPELGIHQMSMSYGQGESYTSNSQMETDDQYFAELATAGVTVFASSGDEGSTPGPDGTGDETGPVEAENPASDPNVTGVGGTTLVLNGSNNVTSETVWNNADGASSGGISSFFSRPAWQTGTGLPSGTKRCVPDVAAAGDPNYGAVVIQAGVQQTVGGTSWGSPTWAAFCALINQARANAGQSSLGLLGPHIYPLLNSSNYPANYLSDFRDITSGNNATNVSGGKYSATAGYDLCTGLGAPLMQTLTQLQIGSSPLIGVQGPAAVEEVTPGQNATFTVSVGGASPSYQWQRMPIGSSSWTTLSDGGAYGGTGTATLTITNATLAMSGDQFQCLVNLGSSTVTPAPPSVLVVDSPLIVSTLAGQAGNSGLRNGTGTGAQFAYPSGIALDTSGNLYIADYNNDEIRKVTPGGAVTTPFGSLNGTAGSSNGTGNSALFNTPNAIAADSSNNLYVADTGNNLIRKIVGNVVSTLAGSNNRFSGPEGIAVDGSGNVYVADTGNDTIREISPGGTVSILAGRTGVAGYADGAATSQALFNGPSSVAVDGSGNVYVADFNNCVIRKISSGTVTTIAGQAGQAGYLDGLGTNALFNAPVGIALDSSNNLYIADSLVPYTGLTTGNNVIRKLSPAGVVSTIAGQAGVSGSANGTGSAAQFYSVQGVAIGSSGPVYLADTYNQTIRAGSSSSVSLSNLALTYNGSPQSATVTTTPPGLSVSVTYNGSGTAPTNAGTYTVVATITDPNYQGSATGTMIIGKASATVMLGNLDVPYDGAPQSATATTNPPGLGVGFLYNGSATPPTNAGLYNVQGAITDPNYQGSATGTMIISKATATVMLEDLATGYDGAAQGASATTTPPGLTVTYTYNGKTTVPTAVGSYTVVGTINSSNYTGSVTGTLVIGQGTAAVTLTPTSLSAVYNGRAHAATATTVPARLAVSFTYNGSAIAPILPGNYNVVATVNTTDYAGNTSGTLTISPIIPLIATSGATPISATSATLTGTTDPEGSPTTVSFQYYANGTVGGYANASQTATQSAGSGTASAAFSIPLGTLPPQTLYHYRAVATNGAGTVYGADKTFTTLAEPVIGTSPAAYLGASGAEIVLSVIPNGVATTVSFEYSTSSTFSTYLSTAPQSVGSGTAPVNVFALFPELSPGQVYYYRMVTTSAAGTFDGDTENFTTLGFETALVAQTGGFAVGSSGPTFAALGNPAVNVNDDVALAGTLAVSASNGVTTANAGGIWADDNTQTRRLIAQVGSAAHGTTANFLTLSDPVYNNNEAVAFRGTLNVPRAQAATATGIWKGDSAADLALVAQEGTQAPGYPTGATFAAFTSLGLSDSGGAIILGTVNTNRTLGISAANDVGIWEGNTTGDLHLLLQLGQSVGGKTITGLTFLPTETYVNGQTRSFNSSSGDLVCGVTFSDKTTGIVEVISGTPQIAALSASTTDPVTGATFATFGNPAININNRIAFAATLAPGVGGVTTATNTGIWADDSGGTLRSIARIGLANGAPLATGTGTFLTLSDPVYNNNEAVAFRGTLNVARAQAATATGIWGNSTGSLALVAQQGVTQAPGCPTGATFSAFTELALPDQGGVIFLATLNASAAAGVTTTNNFGIWAVDTTGTLQLIVRTGDILDVNGVNKTVTGLSFLPAMSVVNGQSRSFAQGNGDLVYLATFSDKSTAIFNVVFP